MYRYNDVMHVKFGQAGLGVLELLSLTLLKPETSKMGHNQITKYCDLINLKTNTFSGHK